MFIKFSFFGVLTFLSTSSALALTCVNDYGGTSSCASNTTAAGDCETLGYSTSDVDNCEHYLYCPFDTSYKRCVTQSETSETVEDCSDYTLESCPTGAICDICYQTSESGGIAYLKRYYKITSCEEGYTEAINLTTGAITCTNNCSSYPLTECPAGGTCTSCTSGTITKFKLESCNSPYVVNGNTCYNCETHSEYLATTAALAENSYLYCCTNCRTSSCNENLYGSFYDQCLGVSTSSPTNSTTLTTLQNQCTNVLNTIKDEIASHNELCTYSSYQVEDNISTTLQCSNSIINNVASAAADGGWNCDDGSIETINPGFDSVEY